MELQSLKSYKSSFNLLKWLTLITVTGSLGLVAFAYFLFVTIGANGYSSVWVVDYKTGEVSKANQKGVSGVSMDERLHEYKHHVEMFCRNYYEFDEYTFKRNVDRSLALVGSYSETLRNKYVEGQVFRKVQENHMRVFCEVDSIKFDPKTTPVRGVFYITQRIERPAGISIRRLGFTFDIMDAGGRTETNPHAAIMDNFKEVLNTVIEK